MAPFYGWGSTTSMLEPLQGDSLFFTTKLPEIPGTHFTTSEEWKDQSTFEPPSGFEHGTPGFGIQRLNHKSTSIMKLFVYKTVKCEVINVEFLRRDLSLNNSAIMEIKCLQLLYPSKGMCRIDSQLKKLIRLKNLILETPYTFLSIFRWYFIVFHTLNFLSPIFSGINNNNFSFFWLFELFLFCVWFYNFKKENIYS